MKVSIVMPAYQNERNIEKIVRSFYSTIISKIPGSEFIITEDGSTDSTRKILKKLAKELHLKLVLGKERKGYQRAVKDGFKKAKNELIFLSDSDGEHSPADFWRLYNCLIKNDADVVVGFKQKRKPFYRFFISRVNNFLLHMLFGLSLHDANCGFRLAKKDLAKKIMLSTGTLKAAFNAEFVIRAKYKNCKILEVPVNHRAIESKVFPPHKLPLVIWKELGRLLALKRELL